MLCLSLIARSEDADLNDPKRMATREQLSRQRYVQIS